MSQDQDKHVAAGDDRKDAWRGQDKGFRGRENGQGQPSDDFDDDNLFCLTTSHCACINVALSYGIFIIKICAELNNRFVCSCKRNIAVPRSVSYARTPSKTPKP